MTKHGRRFHWSRANGYAWNAPAAGLFGVLLGSLGRSDILILCGLLESAHTGAHSGVHARYFEL